MVQTFTWHGCAIKSEVSTGRNAMVEALVMTPSRTHQAHTSEQLRGVLGKMRPTSNNKRSYEKIPDPYE
jgi:hypothetical protein